MVATRAPAPPTVDRLSPRAGLAALAALCHGAGGLLPALERVRAELGDVFQLTLPGFRPVVVAHPDAIRQILVDQRAVFRWRHPRDPVTRLLRHGLLVTDGALHDRLRAVIGRSCQRTHFEARAEAIVAAASRVAATWRPGRRYDLLAEMRKIALLSFEAVFFSHDCGPELRALWRPLLRTLDYIGPGLWLLLPRGTPAPPRAAAALDAHLLRLIACRRAAPRPPDDLLTHLVQAFADDALVRDQLLTMLIAGHDTSTAHLAWTLYLLGTHPPWLARVHDEVRGALDGARLTPAAVRALPALRQVLRESLRLYPPIHALSRTAVHDVELAGYRIAAGTRLLVSVYLVHRHPRYWAAPAAFRPERWAADPPPYPYSYVPFGGGPRNCIGGAFAQLEAPLVLATLLQRWDLHVEARPVAPHMGATLVPRGPIALRVEAPR